MEALTIPDIKRSDLTEVALRLMAIGYDSVKAIRDFEFVDRPHLEVINSAIRDLEAMSFLHGSVVNKPMADLAVQLPVYPG